MNLTLQKASPRQSRKITRAAPWIKYRLLDLILGAALIAPSQAATPDAWITLEAKLEFLITQGFIGTAIHVGTVLGRITSHDKARSVQEKANDRNEIKQKEGRKCKKVQTI